MARARTPASRPARISVDVSSTVRRPAISADHVRRLVTATLESERVRDALVSVALIGTQTMSRLNRDFLSHSGATDVISFGLGRQGGSHPVIGDIYICQSVAERNARKLGIPVRKELARLVIHGTLHVLGHEHPAGRRREASAMWKQQEKILGFIG